MAMRHSYMVDKQATVDVKRKLMQKQVNLEKILEDGSTSAYLAYHDHGVIQGMLETLKGLKLFETVEESIILEKQIKITSLIMELKDKENASQGLASE